MNSPYLYRLIASAALVLYAGLCAAQKTAYNSAFVFFGEGDAVYEHPNLFVGNTVNAVEIAYQLKNYYSVFTENPNCDLALEQHIESPTASHYQFYQTFGGVRLYGAGIRVNIRNNYIYSVSNYLSKLTESPNANFTMDINAVRADIAADANATHAEAAPFLFYYEQKWIPAYQVITFSESQGTSFEWIVNAQNGKLIRQADRVSYHHHHDPPVELSNAACVPPPSNIYVNRKGLVFKPDPCTKSHTTYANPLRDWGNTDDPNFANLYDTVLLRDVTYDTEFGEISLEGPYVKIADREPPYAPNITYTTGGDFLFRRNVDGFEDVMVYYHIDTYQRYIQSLGFQNLCKFPLQADAHGLNGQENSHFVPGTSSVSSYLAYGTGGVDDAEDADVILHEYGHALSFCASPYTTLSSKQRRGLDEGIGDYIAASTSYDADTFRWATLFNWDGNNEFWAGRKAVSGIDYDNTQDEIYAYGTLWASTLMEIRLNLGAATTDKIFLASLYYNSPNTTLLDAAQQFLDTDNGLFGTTNQAIITNIFCEKNLLPESLCTSSIKQPLADAGSPLFSPNPTNQSLNLHLPATWSNPSMNVFDLSGKRLVSQSVNNDQVLDLRLPQGVYLISFEAENQASTYPQKLIVIE